MPPTLNDQAIAAAQAGDFATARRLFEAAIASEPERIAPYANLFRVLHRLGDATGAEAILRRAICVSPDDADLHQLLAQHLIAQGRLREAAISLSHAVRLAPSNAAALNELGNLLQRLGRDAEADEAYQRAIAVDPTQVAALANRARYLADRGRSDEARTLYAQANRTAATPQTLLAAAATLPVIYDSLEHVEQERAALIERLDELHRQGVRIDPTRFVLPNLFYLAYQGENDRDIMQRYAALLTPASERELRLPTPQGSRGKRIRLGVLSKYLTDHTIGHLNLGLLQRLPRERFEVVVFLFPEHTTTTSQLIAQAAERVVPLREDLPSALATVTRAELDVLFYPDLGMDPFTYTLATSRLAPVQVTTWGHPDTTGLTTVDAFLSSAVELPEAQSHYVEQLVRLPMLGAGLARPAAAAPAKRSDFGLPDAATLYGCPQSLFKLHPEFDEVLAGILEADRKAQIVLLQGNHASWTERLAARLMRSLGEHADRVVWLARGPRDRFRQLLPLFDVLLDPLHFGGGHTSYEAFAYGVPVVTLPARYLRGRLTLAMLRQMGLEQELAVKTIGEYVERAVRLANDRAERKRLSGAILAQCGELFAAERAAQAVSKAFESLAAKLTPRP
jgi:predicted O-linked N-acetylglucosamine transferase (SPINDLY family)